MWDLVGCPGVALGLLKPATPAFVIRGSFLLVAIVVPFQPVEVAHSLPLGAAASVHRFSFPPYSPPLPLHRVLPPQLCNSSSFW